MKAVITRKPQLPKVVHGDEVAGLSPSFCRALVWKIRQLREEKRFWEGGKEPESDLSGNLTILASACVNQLERQIFCTQGEGAGYCGHTQARVDEFLEVVEEILELFPPSQ